jgi:nucleotide-binding universal stress UspA family protein
MAGELVVCFDGSEGAHGALAKAIELAPRLNAAVVIVYGYEVSRIGGEVADLAAALRERGELIAEAGLAAARDAGIEAGVALLDGSPARVIAEHAAELGAAMIVTGTRSEKPLTGALVGSFTHRMINVSTLPLLCVPHAGR